MSQPEQAKMQDPTKQYPGPTGEATTIKYPGMTAEMPTKETAALVKEAGRKCVVFPGDIRDEAHCKAIVDRAVSELGGLDILKQQDNILDITTEQFDRTMKTNLYAMFWLSKYAVPHMPSGATIINTSSIEGFQPEPDLLEYAMTKAAIVNFTKGLGKELISKGIRVNSVAPGPIWTPLIPSTLSEEKIASLGKQAPYQRPGQPAELAPAYVFFASQESSYITAETLAVTGGMIIT